jgi:hypothetical protein
MRNYSIWNSFKWKLLYCQAGTQTCDPESFSYATLARFISFSKRPSRNCPYSNSIRSAFLFCVWLKPMLSLPTWLARFPCRSRV